MGGDTAADLTARPGRAARASAPVFAAHGQPLTRYGIYKIIRRHASRFDDPRTGRRVSPHTFRHTAAVHLLEAGVEVNVIRGWLGHADLVTTNARRDQHQDQAGSPASRGTARCFGGIPDQPNLAIRPIPAQLARLAVMVTRPATAPPSRSPPVTRDASRRWPHNTAGHTTGIMWRAT